MIHAAMISNERSWPGRQQPNRRPYYQAAAPQMPRPFIQEYTLKSEQLQIERKSFLLTLKENPRGRFLRISEETNGKRNSVIVPSTGLLEFQKLLAEMVEAENMLPVKSSPGETEPPTGV